MPLTLSKPMMIGDLTNQREVSQVEIVGISINLQKNHVDKNIGVLSLLLEDPVTGYVTTVTYRDSTVLEFLGGLKEEFLALLGPVWDKLQADGKLPAGTIAIAIPQETAIDTAVTIAAAKLASPVVQSLAEVKEQV
jgi:hypothetical protein